MFPNHTTAATRCSNDLVSVRNNQVVTSSLQVAKVFDKEHRRVLQSIRELECSPKFREHNFVQSFYVREIEDRGQRKYPLYYMTRDGFTFLVMGFTGKIAAQFKEAYIKAFNEMEKAISTSKEGECIAKELQKYCTTYSRSVKNIHADCKQKFGFATYYGDMPVSLTYHKEWSVQQNLKYILPRLSCALADGWYAAHRLIKTEQELSELRKTLSGVMDTLLHKHRILP